MFVHSRGPLRAAKDSWIVWKPLWGIFVDFFASTQTHWQGLVVDRLIGWSLISCKLRLCVAVFDMNVYVQILITTYHIYLYNICIYIYIYGHLCHMVCVFSRKARLHLEHDTGSPISPTCQAAHHRQAAQTTEDQEDDALEEHRFPHRGWVNKNLVFVSQRRWQEHWKNHQNAGENPLLFVEIKIACCLIVR